MTERALSEIDVAAGGLLLRRDGDDVRIAVVHRHRFDDWALPKGHAEADEGLREAALREVREETGCSAKLGRMLEPVSYLAAGVPKLVVFFEMELVSEGGPLDPDEVTEVHWLSPTEAHARLSYPSERTLVRAALGPIDE